MTDDLKIKTLFVSKLNTALLILFVLLHLFNLAVVAMPEYFFSILTIAFVVTSVVCGALYVILWSTCFINHTKDSELNNIRNLAQNFCFRLNDLKRRIIGLRND
jgi:hypothetical protein